MANLSKSEEMAFILGGNIEEETKEKTTAKSTQRSKAKAKVLSGSSGLFDDLTEQAKPTRFTIDLDPALAKRFEAGAKRYKMPKAKFLRAIMKRAFDDMGL